jgi:hypothetical protein
MQNNKDDKDDKDETITLSRINQHKTKRASMIVACCIVSESEIAMIMPEYTSSYETEHPEGFKDVLFKFGMDVTQEYKRQDALQHRNKVNQVVTCSRWVGSERIDLDWINSGYASKEAIDKYSGSKILEDLYRERGETQDTQDYLNERDIHTVVDESVWIK